MSELSNNQILRNYEMALENNGTLTQLRAFLAQENFAENTKLPAERNLCELLGVSRNDLRKALSILESNGELWRHVGKGTFVGRRPVDEKFSFENVAARSNPREVMRARFLIEPILAGEAAFNASGENIEQLIQCQSQSKHALTWRQYENHDNNLHRLIAVASNNNIMLALFDQLNAIRRTVVWGRLRLQNSGPPEDHHSFTDHGRIISAISNRDVESAKFEMRRHLENVQKNLLNSQSESEFSMV